MNNSLSLFGLLEDGGSSIWFSVDFFLYRKWIRSKLYGGCFKEIHCNSIEVVGEGVLGVVVIIIVAVVLVVMVEVKGEREDG